ncbi:MAG: carboxypeptidase regulatory-like domain-containing protein [Gemmatimonadales bacterium]
MRIRRPLAAAALFRDVTRCLYVVLAVAALGIIPVAGRAQSTEIVRGKITGVDGKPIENVNVTITGLATQASLTVPTNEKGIFTALFPNPEGDYLLNIRKIGYAPYNTRVTRTGLSTVLIADVTLKEMPFQLDTINVAARAAAAGDGSSIGGVTSSLLQGALFSLDPTDLVGLAAQIPGILSLGDSAYSVLGAGSNANSSSIDGAKFGGQSLPQDAIASSNVIQSSADPAIGGFGGGQTATTLKGGTDVFAMTMRGNFADHHLAWTDPAWPRPIPRVGTWSGGAGGPIVAKKLHYQASWNVSDRSSDIYSLLDPPQSIISQYGFTMDTINAVSGALSNLGVPLGTGTYSGNAAGHNYNTSLVLDWTPKGTTAIRLTHSGYWGNNSSPGQAPSSYPSQGSSFNNSFQFLSAKLSGYVHGFLDDLNMTLNYNHFASQPFLSAPSASVRVGTVFDDGHTGLGNINFGGGSGVNTNTGYDWTTRNEFSWIPGSGKHRVKVGQEFDYSWNSDYSSGNQYGSYSYQTLADLQANKPASYSLTLSSFERSSHGAEASFWLGDEWSASKALQFQGGLRYDGAYPGTLPSYNPAVYSAFGLSTDKVPHTWFVTPRLGFSWASAKRRRMGSSTGQNGPIQLGNLPANLPPEFLMLLLGTPRGSVAPGWAINGSIGGYGSPLDNGNIAGLIDETGLPNTRRVLTCVGDATPIPDWSSNAAAPTSCLDGSGPATFSADAPTVQVFDPNFKVPLNWRANLGIDGIRLPMQWTLGVTTFLNYGVHGQSALDRNLNRNVEFTLPDEGNRPVYVTPDNIVPSTGVVAPNAYRLNTDYGSVRDVISDLSNYTEQIQATIRPPKRLIGGKLDLSFTYVYNHSRREQRGLGGGGDFGGGGIFIKGGGIEAVRIGGFGGFGGGGGSYAVDGDPFTKSWVPGTQPTHQITTNASFRLWWFNMNLRLNIYSGQPFTPSVVGDVNGDGLNDDIAFVPNPATTHDTALATQMNQLLATTPAGARNCLLKQMGRVAGINSCTTQWQARLDLRLDWQPPRSFGFGDRLRLTMQMQNTSGALVRLFGLENTPLGRGALSQQANSQLLYVTGFDPATRSYQYQVNQLFGQPANFGTSRRNYPPFQLQLGVEYKLGGPPTAPMALSMGLLPGSKQPPYTIDQIREKLRRLSRDPVQQILVRKDTMALTKEQVTRLEAISAEFRARSDSALEPVLDYVIKKGRRIDDQQLSKRLQRAQPVIHRMLIDADSSARALLTPAQLKMLPPTPTLPGVMMPRPGAGKGDLQGGKSPDEGARIVKLIGPE